jgi:hypothetical protein
VAPDNDEVARVRGSGRILFAGGYRADEQFCRIARGRTYRSRDHVERRLQTVDKTMSANGPNTVEFLKRPNGDVPFQTWFNKLRDRELRSIIVSRLERLNLETSVIARTCFSADKKTGRVIWSRWNRNSTLQRSLVRLRL